MSGHRSLRDAVWARAAEGAIDSSELLILLRLVEHWPRIFPGIDTLALWTRTSPSTVQRAMRRLESKRLIRVILNPGRVSSYQFLGPRGEPLTWELGPSHGDTPVNLTPPPVMVTPPTPVMVTPEADPDLKQTIKAGGRGTRAPTLRPMPEDFEPNAADLTCAANERKDPARELADFRDWTTAKGVRYTDWHAGFRSHLRRRASTASVQSAAPAKLRRDRTVAEALKDFR